MALGVLADEPWLPDALTVAPDVRAWLSDLRKAAEDYEDWPQNLDASTVSLTSDASCDHFNLNKYFSAEEDSFSEWSVPNQNNDDLYSNAFDDILSTLGNEIYRLDSYRSNANVVPGDVADEIMSMLEECKSDVIRVNSVDRQSDESEARVPRLNKVCSFSNISILSDEVFLKSGSSGNSNLGLPQRHSYDVNRIFDKGEGVPVPPRRRNRYSSGSTNVNLETSSRKPRPTSMMEGLQIKMDASDAMDDSDSGNNSPTSDYSDYQNIWNCTSGFKNGAIVPKIRLLKQNYGLINAISVDSVKDISNSSLDISSGKVVHAKPSYANRPTGTKDDRRSQQRYDDMNESENKVVECTPECDLTDECHRTLAKSYKSNSFVYTPGRNERIYENVEFLRSARQKTLIDSLKMSTKNDEDNSSVEIISDSDSWRTPMGRDRTTSSSTDYASESPIYENLHDYAKRPLTGDVLAWKALLLDPYWNDDEEDEWVSTEEATEYAEVQKPPFVIPKIRQITPRNLPNEEPKSPSIKDVCKKFEEEIMNKAHHDFSRLRTPNKFGVHNDFHEKSHFHQHTETSPITLRKSTEGLRLGKAKSMITGDKKEQIKYLPQVLPRAYESNMPVLLEGTLNRTKLIENGRKVRKKNWHREYAVMTQTSLAFYKDKKTYDSVRDFPEKSISVSPEIIKLRGAVAGKTTTQQTSRLNAIVITSDPSTQYLIHHDDPAVAQSWLNEMAKAINKLPSDYKCPENINLNTPLVGTPSPTHKHISKIKSSKVIEGSVEDLTDLPEHAVIRSKLKKFFNRRPTVESLIKSKIYQDEPIFGRKLEQVCPETNPRIPEFVMHCIKIIESTEENMASDGLYRASGNLSQVQKIRVEVNQNNMSVLEKEPDVNVLTGALKLFFRELKEPLIPFKLFQPCLNASANPLPEARIKEFREIVDSLPECNRQTLKYLLEHLLRVTARKEKNRMHISNLAIVLGPTLLLAPPEASQNMAFECLQQNRVIEIFMSDFDKIFKEDGKRRK